MAKKREAQAYVPNSTKSPKAPQGKYQFPDSGAGRMQDPTGDQSKAPAVKPGMQPNVPKADYSFPDSGSGRPIFKSGDKYELGDQSKPPKHKKEALPSLNAPVDVKGVNAGSDYPLPKGGGKGETEV